MKQREDIIDKTVRLSLSCFSSFFLQAVIINKAIHAVERNRNL